MSVSKKIVNLYLRYKEYIIYIFFGVLTTLVNWISYAVLTKKINVNIIWANSLAWLIAVIFAYITNKIYVFESKSWKVKTVCKEIILFFGARCLSGILEIFSFPILIKCGLNQSILGIEGFLAKILIGIIVTIINYVLSKWAIFKQNLNGGN